MKSITGSKGAFISTIIGLCLLVLFFARASYFPHKGSIDIHVHDTYVVTTYGFITGFIILTLANFFSLGGVIGSSFTDRKYWLMLLIFFAVDVFCIYYYKFYHFFS